MGSKCLPDDTRMPLEGRDQRTKLEEQKSTHLEGMSEGERDGHERRSEGEETSGPRDKCRVSTRAG